MWLLNSVYLEDIGWVHQHSFHHLPPEELCFHQAHLEQVDFSEEQRQRQREPTVWNLEIRKIDFKNSDFKVTSKHTKTIRRNISLFAGDDATAVFFFRRLAQLISTVRSGRRSLRMWWCNRQFANPKPSGGLEGQSSRKGKTQINCLLLLLPRQIYLDKEHGQTRNSLYLLASIREHSALKDWYRFQAGTGWYGPSKQKGNSQKH